MTRQPDTINPYVTNPIETRVSQNYTQNYTQTYPQTYTQGNTQNYTQNYTTITTEPLRLSHIKGSRNHRLHLGNIWE